MLHDVLHDRLYLGVRIAHNAVQFPHFPDVEFAHDNAERDDCYRDEGEHAVHGIEIDERAGEEQQGGQSAWQSLSEESDDSPHIAFQPVHYVTAVVCCLRLPFRAYDALYHALLHSVLRLYSEYASYPYA